MFYRFHGNSSSPSLYPVHPSSQCGSIYATAQGQDLAEGRVAGELRTDGTQRHGEVLGLEGRVGRLHLGLGTVLSGGLSFIEKDDQKRLENPNVYRC